MRTVRKGLDVENRAGNGHEEPIIRSIDIGIFWDNLIRFEYDRQLLINGIEEFIGINRSLKILDCACGTGFPA
jgi:hypothetical protein